MLLKLLNKLGLQYEKLTSFEKESFAEYEAILNKPGVTLEDVKVFIKNQIESLNNSLMIYENSKDKDLYLKACLRNMIMLDVFINSTDNQKKQVVKELKAKFHLDE